ncbi:MAG: hypothetical protein WC707_05605 [Candidatus Babeliaceae bacterium]|jgi:hypothetical protein
MKIVHVALLALIAIKTSSIVCESNAQDGIQNKKLNYYKKTVSGTKNIALGYSVVRIGNLCHELGRYIPARAFGHTTTMSLPLNPRNQSRVYFSEEVFNALKTKIIPLAGGPLSGIIGNYCILKLANIFHEYRNNHTIEHAIHAGLNKPAINRDHNTGLLAAALYNTVEDIANLILTKDAHGKSNGSHTIDSLIKNHSEIKKQLYYACFKGFVMIATGASIPYFAYKTYAAHQNSTPIPAIPPTR